MTTQEKAFGFIQIPETKSRKTESNDQKENKKRSYGNKYLQNRRSISVEETIVERLDALQKKRMIKTKGELFTYLANLEEKVDPAFSTLYRCKTCGEEVKDIPKHINVNKFTHKDLCVDSSCKGYIVIKKEMSLDDNGNIISNKDKANGTTTKSDKNSGSTDAKDKVTKSWMTPKGLVETIGDNDYINGKKVRTYIGSDPQQPMLDEEYDD